RDPAKEARSRALNSGSGAKTGARPDRQRTFGAAGRSVAGRVSRSCASSYRPAYSAAASFSAAITELTAHLRVLLSAMALLASFRTSRLAAERISLSDYFEMCRLHRDARVMATLGGVISDEET